jgi:hypothetical protein
MREMGGSPQYMRHLEELVLRMPNAGERLPMIRERMKAIAAKRAAAAGETAGA